MTRDELFPERIPYVGEHLAALLTDESLRELADQAETPTPTSSTTEMVKALAGEVLRLRGERAFEHKMMQGDR